MMQIQIEKSKSEMGKAAAQKAVEILKKTITEKGEASIIVATGASQFEVLENFSSNREIDWSKVTMFHLDEYIGLPLSHPASFRKYLIERFVDKVSPKLNEVILINGEAEKPQEECEKLSATIQQYDIDLAFVGFGENGHLAFNDPPADFETNDPYIVVKLDEACRKQQFGEGWFPSFEKVPKEAISMSIKQIMKANTIICSVPEKRKAEAVKNCFGNEISNLFPATMLQKHPQCFYFLDEEAASLLSK